MLLTFVANIWQKIENKGLTHLFVKIDPQHEYNYAVASLRQISWSISDYVWTWCYSCSTNTLLFCNFLPSNSENEILQLLNVLRILGIKINKIFSSNVKYWPHPKITLASFGAKVIAPLVGSCPCPGWTARFRWELFYFRNLGHVDI